MEQGDFEKTILRDCAASGMPLPEKIKNAPVLQLGLALYFNAFHDLDSCRTLGMGEGRIPWIVIKQYAVLNFLSEEQTENLIYHIMKMDVAFLNHLRKKS